MYNSTRTNFKTYNLILNLIIYQVEDNSGLVVYSFDPNTGDADRDMDYFKRFRSANQRAVDRETNRLVEALNGKRPSI